MLTSLSRLATAFALSCCFLLPWLSSHGSVGIGLGSALVLGSTVLLLALLLCAAHVFRRASAALFFVCLSASFTSPSTIVHFVGGLSDIVVCIASSASRRFCLKCRIVQGPFVMSMVMASVFRLGSRYPLDASFFLFLGGNASVLLYASTLLLHVQFRGDFGLLSDSALIKNGRGARRKASTASCFDWLTGHLQDIARAPIDDAQFMLSPSQALPLSTRMHSLRDAKEV